MTKEQATTKPVGNSKKKRTRVIMKELEKGIRMNKRVWKSVTFEKRASKKKSSEKRRSQD
jgi:ribosomal protein S6